MKKRERVDAAGMSRVEAVGNDRRETESWPPVSRRATDRRQALKWPAADTSDAIARPPGQTFRCRVDEAGTGVTSRQNSLAGKMTATMAK